MGGGEGEGISVTSDVQENDWADDDCVQPLRATCLVAAMGEPAVQCARESIGWDCEGVFVKLELDSGSV